MQSTIPPSFEDVKEALKPLLPIILKSMEEGTRHAQDYSEWQREQIDRALAPCIVRHRAKKVLLSEGQAVRDEEEDLDFEPEQVSNNGLCISVPGYQIRILKSDNGSIPPPGISKARNRFYAQQLSFPGIRDDEDLDLTWGIVVHWTVDGNYNLVRLSLSLPKSGGKSSGAVETYWDEPFWTRQEIQPQPVPEVEAEDLDLQLEIEEPPNTLSGTQTENDLWTANQANSRVAGVDPD